MLHTPPGRPALEVVYESESGAQAEYACDQSSRCAPADTRSIIAVPGLGADVDWSWTWKDPADPKNPDLHVKWLQDPGMLPAIVPDSRILLYNYDSRWHAEAPKTRFRLCGEELIRSVRDFREKTASRPIVFVGHSLGGNIIQHALLYANSDDQFRHVATSTAGVVFLGSPLRGSKFQPWSQILASFLRFAGSHDGIVRDLGYDNEDLMDKLHQFCQMCDSLSIPTSCFFELHDTNYLKKMLGVGWLVGWLIRGRVVDEASACIPGRERISLAANHSEMNKFSGPGDRSFQSVAAELRTLCEAAPDVVQRRAQRSPFKSKPGGTVRADVVIAKPTKLVKVKTSSARSVQQPDAVPWPGETYIIIDKDSGRAITRIDVDGKLRLERTTSQTDGNRWHCFEKKGWFGFRELKSGKVMGRSFDMEFLANVNHQAGWEKIGIRSHPGGGYLLLCQHWSTLLEMAIGEDDTSLVARENGGTKWEFVRIE